MIFVLLNLQPAHENGTPIRPFDIGSIINASFFVWVYHFSWLFTVLLRRGLSDKKKWAKIASGAVCLAFRIFVLLFLFRFFVNPVIYSCKKSDGACYTYSGDGWTKGLYAAKTRVGKDCREGTLITFNKPCPPRYVATCTRDLGSGNEVVGHYYTDATVGYSEMEARAHCDEVVDGVFSIAT